MQHRSKNQFAGNSREYGNLSIIPPNGILGVAFLHSVKARRSEFTTDEVLARVDRLIEQAFK